MNQTTPNKFVFKKERGFGDIIGDSFSFITKNYKSSLSLFIKVIGPLLILSVVVNVFFQYKVGSLFTDLAIFSNSNFVNNNITSILSYLLLYIVVELFIIPFTIFLFTLCLIKDYLNQKKINTSGVISNMKEHAWGFLLYAILTLLVLIFTTIIVMFIFSFIIGIFSMGSPIIAGILLIPMILVMFIPIGFVFIYFMLGMSISVMEDIGIGDSLSKSASLLKNNWWMTLAIFFVFYIIIFILSYIFQLPSTIYTFMESFTAFESAESYSDSEGVFSSNMYQNWVSLLFTAIASIGQNLMSIFKYVMIALVYFNLSEKQEFKGTYDQIDQIGN